MKAEKVETFNGPVYVIVQPSPGDANLYRPNTIITLDGAYASILADGIIRMVNESQCSVCGRFNGLHGEIYIKTSQDMGGSVEGYFTMCPNAPGIPKS